MWVLILKENEVSLREKKLDVKKENGLFSELHIMA